MMSRLTDAVKAVFLAHVDGAFRSARNAGAQRAGAMVSAGLLLSLLTAASAAADIYVSPPSVEAWTEVLAPDDGEVFVVPSPSDTVSVTALGYTTISYFARATLDIEPFTGEASGGTLFHYYSFAFDGVTISNTVPFYVPDAPPGEDQGAWAYYDLTLGFDVLSITRNVGVGYHDVLLQHRVFDQRSEIHIATSDYIIFEVIAAPEPTGLALFSLGLLGLVVLRWGVRTTDSRY